jgi:hypothetical protein
MNGPCHLACDSCQTGSLVFFVDELLSFVSGTGKTRYNRLFDATRPKPNFNPLPIDMKKSHFFLFCVLLFWVPLTTGCGDIEDEGKLESISVVPESYHAKLNSHPKQFLAVGHYSNGTTDDITNEVKWTDDSTTDSAISHVYPGLVYFRSVGWFAVIAKQADATGDEEIKGMALICVWKEASTDCQ